MLDNWAVKQGEGQYGFLFYTEKKNTDGLWSFLLRMGGTCMTDYKAIKQNPRPFVLAKTDGPGEDISLLLKEMTLIPLDSVDS